MERHISVIICSLGLVLSMASCQKENGQGQSGENREIRIVRGIDVVESKTAPVRGNKEEVLFTMPFVTEDGETLSIEASISDMPEEFTPGSVDTKAVPITTENLKTKYEKFMTTVYTTAGGLYTDELGKKMENITATYGSDTWILQGAPYRWPASKTEDIVFCSYAPIGGNTGISNLSWNNGNSLSFGYVNTPSGDGSDAVNQKDILFAINRQNCNDNGGEARINFSHALVGVKFIKGDIEDCTINSVSLKQFKSQGSATAVPFKPSGTSVSRLNFTWSGQSTLKDYVQNFGTQTSTVGDKASLDPDLDESRTFMMIPQKLDANASLEIVTTDSKGEHTISINLGSINSAQAGSEANAAKLSDWSSYAGKMITIRVSHQYVSLEVTDRVTVNVKDNVSIKNTGNANAYVRAAILGYWVNSDGNLVAPWNYNPANPSASGFTGLVASGTTSSNWEYNALDNYYYYKQPVEGGAALAGTSALFTSYTAPTEAPISGSHLEMVIAVQAVMYDEAKSNVKNSWGANTPLTSNN